MQFICVLCSQSVSVDLFDYVLFQLKLSFVEKTTMASVGSRPGVPTVGYRLKVDGKAMVVPRKSAASPMESAMKWRRITARAIMLGKYALLRTALMQLSSLNATPEMLAETGLLMLLGAEAAFDKAGIKAKRDVLYDKWSAMLAKAFENYMSWMQRCRDLPFRGLPVTDFRKVVNSMEMWLRQGRERDKSVRYRQMALQLALVDFDTPESLDGVIIEDLNLEGGAWDFATTKRALEASRALGMAKRAKHVRILVQQEMAKSEGFVVTSAAAVAEKIPDNLDESWKELDKRSDLLGVPEMVLKSSIPMKTIKSLGVAACMGHDVVCLLADAADLTILEKKRGSLPSVRSGIKAWNAFAFEVLQCPLDKTFPPVCGRDLAIFWEISKNVGIGLNYIGHVVFAANWARCSLQFVDEYFIVATS